jgi:hypothetical protein
LLALPLALLLALALHEAGHVTAGLLCGFEFRLFVVGPIRVDRRDGHLKVSVNRVAALWGGIAGCVPASFGPRLQRHMIFFAAGGPVSSLLGATLLIPGLTILKAHASAAILLTTFALISASLGMVTLCPMRMGGFTSDGMRLFMLLRRKPEGQRWTALAALGGLSQTLRPRDWPPQLMALLGDGMDAQADAVIACLLWHMWYVDKREYDSARMWLERGLNHTNSMPPSMQPVAYLAAAQFYARHGADPALARQYFELAEKPGLHNAEDTHIARAAVLVTEARAAEALSELDIAERQLRLKPAAMAEWMREDINELRALIN